MNDPVNAMGDFKAAIQMNPGYALAHFNAANLLFSQRQFHRVSNRLANTSTCMLRERRKDG